MKPGTLAAGDDAGRQLDQLAHGFWHSAILMAGLELGVPAALAAGPKSAGKLATELNCDPRGMEILLGAMAALDLIVAEGGRWRLADAYREMLVSGGPSDQTAILAHLGAMWGTWGQLAASVRTGRPGLRPELPERQQAAHFRDFIRGMAQVSRESASAFAELPPAAKARRVLDVGGGPGIYAIEMLRRQPELRATILDRPLALEVARENAEAAGVADRLELREGDVLKGDYGNGFDLVLMSQLLHAFGETECRAIIRRGAMALAPGGTLAINEFALAEDGAGPPRSAIFACNMLVNTDGGRTWKLSQMQHWLREAGLKPDGQQDLIGRSMLVLGKKLMGGWAGGGR